jgi:ABC-type Na+ efflux pump permease subunit
MEKKRKRRGFIVLLVALGVAFSLVAFSSSAVMAATLSIGDDTVTTDNGAITGVTVDVSGDVTWDGAENQPGSTDVELQVQNPDGSWETIDSKTEDLSGLAGTYSYSFTDVDVTYSNWNNGDFNAGGDGATKETELTFRLLVEPSGDLDGQNGAESFTSSEDTATVTAQNEANSNGASGNGGVNASGKNNEP